MIFTLARFFIIAVDVTNLAPLVTVNCKRNAHHLPPSSHGVKLPSATFPTPQLYSKTLKVTGLERGYTIDQLVQPWKNGLSKKYQ